MSEVAARTESASPSEPTFLGQPPERRRSARVPISGPIRVGPPHRDPHARLSATDLSTGGMFIDADRPVRVGARFCAEIVLSDGRHLYIPEAEVAYNRDRPHGAGFGVRFVDLSDDVRQMLEDEVARLGSEPMAEEGVDLGLDDREPTVSVPPLATDAPDAPGLASTAPLPLDRPERFERRRASDAWSRLRHEARAMTAQLPSLWLVLAGLGGALLVAAVGLVIWAELSTAPRVVTRPADAVPSGLTSKTHQRLMGEDVPEDLPPLAPLVPPAALDREGVADRASGPAPSSDAAPAPKTRGARLERRPPAASASGEAPAGSRPDPLPPGAAPIGRVGLPEDARIERTSRLRSPPRFVVDVVGLDRMPDRVEVDASRVDRVRFGRHEGFGRLVFDLTRSAGRLTHRPVTGGFRLVELD